MSSIRTVRLAGTTRVEFPVLPAVTMKSFIFWEEIHIIWMTFTDASEERSACRPYCFNSFWKLAFALFSILKMESIFYS
jgi:hypothetical protein